jgi:hypothetical protein
MTIHHGTPRYLSVGGLRKAIDKKGFDGFPYSIRHLPSGMVVPVFHMEPGWARDQVVAAGFQIEELPEGHTQPRPTITLGKLKEYRQTINAHERIARGHWASAQTFIERGPETYPLASRHTEAASIAYGKARALRLKLLEFDRPPIVPRDRRMSALRSFDKLFTE